jgi:AraC-like DNA-binding protein
MTQGGERPMPAAAEFPRTAGFMTRLAYDYALKTGLPASALARRAGLAPRAIQDADIRLDARDQIAFLDGVSVAADDDSFGFHLAQDADLRATGLFYYVLTSSSRLIEVFQRGARYTSLVNEGIRQTCIDQRTFGLELHAAAAAHRTNRHEIQFWITTVLRLSRQLTGRRLSPQRVCFAHGRGQHVAELGRYFSCDIEYAASSDSIMFGAPARELPIVNADPHLNRLLVEFSEQAMRRQRRRGSAFESMVQDAIATLLPHGEAGMRAVASHLGISERTLGRKLATVGTAFATLRAQLRRDLAQRYLAEPGLSISQIAWLLGFSDVAAFSHAFRRWTGLAPRQARSPPAIL